MRQLRPLIIREENPLLRPPCNYPPTLNSDSGLPGVADIHACPHNSFFFGPQHIGALGCCLERDRFAGGH